MQEENIIILPEDWREGAKAFPLVAEGEYGVIVHKAARLTKDRAFVEFVILDDGPFAKRHLFQTFGVTTEGGRRAFSEFLDAIGIDQQERVVNLNACERKLLQVAVKHHERDDKVYANVVAFMKAGA